ncbi:MAG: amino acid decarboxylase [Ruminococcaceae bacterium]|nr:amino acid decarboxylase [Oscillospiraceae bacterium]
MKTPICDFLKKYNNDGFSRLHMPGHKGVSFVGCEEYDLTEISGADSLYHANGIIKESEENAACLFGTSKTLYSTEGSSLSIRAICYLAKSYATSNGLDSNYILATRNAHSSFISASVLLDFYIEWMHSEGNYICSEINAEILEKRLSCVDKMPFAVYITSPDYLGNTLDISGISAVCKKYNVPLLVDNAHGAYLKFLEKSKHPIDLGATLCVDSAHKTLPVLTGGGYLHISKDAPAFFKENAKIALSLFGSTSPSYLILKSLDNANRYISNGYRENLSKTINKISNLKSALIDNGYKIIGDEGLKLTIMPKPYGYYGKELYDILYSDGIVCEFCDPDFLVMMFTPESTDSDIERLKSILLNLPKKNAILDTPPIFSLPKTIFSTKNAYFMPREKVSVSDAPGRVLAVTSITCPPAVSIAVCGEEISEDVINACKYYGIDSFYVIKN